MCIGGLEWTAGIRRTRAMDWLNQLSLFVIMLLANMLSALSGGWAGQIQLQELIFLGLPFGVALATHKISTVALVIGATLRYLKSCRC